MSPLMRCTNQYRRIEYFVAVYSPLTGRLIAHPWPLYPAICNYLTKRKKASRSQLLSMLSLVKSGPRGIFSCPFSLNL